jgi:hypothetical protein
MQKLAEKVPAAGLDLSCTGCAKVDVCTIYRSVAPLLQNWTDETRPFEAETLGRFCKSWFSKAMVDALRSTSEGPL